ncbi:hypothetical protein JY651_33350 [Pyxidicoccus parkwayensis]|uniref:TonB C-terminal domain-containing protein n=1 Tax=Pyxidicoccus parkwayensis TaxID=2813578 RepID=A0ABX7NRR9_9BACT|nr:hypothetical protein [Pyxidicoccus parkwaysis]QSQ20134.1 hypothetical protein JY651_33350 [Pyxidicoccus parkwaysis]
MNRYVVALSSWLMLAAGCRHATMTGVPELPASHGHLSSALDRYLAKQQGSPEQAASTSFTLFSDASQAIVEPTDARRVFTEARVVLESSPSEEQVRLAANDLKGACQAGLTEACAFLRERLKRPTKLSGEQPQIPPKAFENVIAKKRFTIVVVQCRLGVSGKFRDCDALEEGTDGLTESVLKALASSTYQPATLAGHPIDVPYTMTVGFVPPGTSLTTEQRLQWFRTRVARFPRSHVAWKDLAEMLAMHAPGDPGYASALGSLNALEPWHWWAASELAWLHVQAGRHAEAEPLIQQALTTEWSNPYVLETSAAVMIAGGRCEPALLQQRRAVTKLPPEWPAPERERFTRTLEDYQRRCPTANATPASEPAQAP